MIKRKFFFLFLLASLNCFAVGFELFEESGKIGLKNEEGLVLLPPAFDALGWSDGSFSVIGQITGYKLNGNWGLINLKKEFVTQAEFESLTFSGADRVIAKKRVSSIAVKAGSLTLTGEVTIPFQYDAISIHGMRAIVMNKNGVDYQVGLADLNNRLLIPLKFNSIYPVSSIRFAVEDKQSKLALFSDAGKQMTRFFIDSISKFQRSYAIIYSDGWEGVIDRDGVVVADPNYRAIQFKNDGSIQVLQRDNWKIIDQRNREIKSLQADDLRAFHQKTYSVTRSGLVGVINEELQEVWPFEYEAIGAIKNDLVPAKKKGKWGLLLLDRSEILSFDYDSIHWDGEVALTLSHNLEKEQWWLMNVKKGVKSNKSYDVIQRLNNENFITTRNNYYGLVSNDGIETVHCVYDSILDLRGNQLAVRFKNYYGIISTHENWILAPQEFPVKLVNDSLYFECQPGNTFLKSLKGDIIYFSENRLEVNGSYLIEYLPSQEYKLVNLSGVQVLAGQSTGLNSNVSSNEREGLTLFIGQGKFGFRDAKGRLQIANRYDSAKLFSDQLAAFKLLGRWGYLDTDDKIVVHPTFDFAGDFQNGFAIVSRNRKMGLIDKSGTVHLSLEYDSIIRIDNKFRITINGRIGLANAEGKVLVDPHYEYLKVLPNDQVLVGLDHRFGIISSDGLSVVPITYSSILYDELKNLYLAHLPAEWTELKISKK